MEIFMEPRFGVDINKIICTEAEIPDAMHILEDNYTQVRRITLLVGNKAIFIHNSTFSGRRCHPPICRNRS